ncbi:hypothetical protein F4780DRAFT_738977 [Xylariomycetidae sp. FL0641]|nr:hypothetical protein F4780DRAFT_738977 [Xylariomycetidae sp. FL0641]
MLMPSALACDSSHPPSGALQSSLFASPPASPPTSAQNSLVDNIFNSCRALQSMLTTPPPVASSNNAAALRDQLPTPPLSHAPLPPIKLRLRSRKQEPNGDTLPRKKVVKRPAPPPRGINKRRRSVGDDMGRDDDVDSELDIDGSGARQTRESQDPFRPSTPKRARIAPETIPFGLDRSDFHELHDNYHDEVKKEGTEVEVEAGADVENWSQEDDRILVELVLEKLKLSKSDWQECARSLGKDRGSIGRRWKSLMGNGDVGLRARGRRSTIHNTWR